MALPGSLIEQLCEHLSRHVGTHVDLEREVPVGGGSINDCYRLVTNSGTFFVKVNSADRYPSMFEAEADGLHRLGDTATVRVPKVIAVGEDHDDAYLLLEHIEAGVPTTAFWRKAGQQLAALHQCSAPLFGLERDNYIGSLPQLNTPCTTWPEFFISRRLEPLVKRARDHHRLSDADALRFERLYLRLPSLFPEEPPALLHGDLWNGNVLCDSTGDPVVFDPAVYYGHREMDIAMMRLFGGPDPAFMASYNEVRAPQPGWEARMDLCNLYPLLVHADLFGGRYPQQVREILAAFE